MDEVWLVVVNSVVVGIYLALVSPSKESLDLIVGAAVVETVAKVSSFNCEAEMSVESYIANCPGIFAQSKAVISRSPKVLKRERQYGNSEYVLSGSQLVAGGVL
jgi:hypothetical protein